MRRIAALALVVFLYGVRAQAGTTGAPADWAEIHAKAVEELEKYDVDTAVNLLTQCRAMAKSPEQLGITENDLGAALSHIGHTREAKQWLEQALEIWKTNRESSVRFGQTAVTLSEVQRELGQYAESEQLLRQALAKIPAATSSPDASEVRALAMYALGDMLREEGRTAESRTLLSDAARMPGVSWRRTADCAMGLAELDKYERRWGESIDEWNRLGDIGRAHNDPAVAHTATRGLGQTWLERGDAARAEPLLRNALSAFEADRGSTDVQQANTLTSLGQLYLGQNKLALAEDSFTRALQMEEHVMGDGSPQVAVILGHLGDTLARRSQMDLARNDLDRATKIMRTAFGEQSVVAAAALAHWAIVEQQTSNWAAAASLFEKALAALNNARSAEVARLKVTVLERYAATLKSLNRKREAGQVLSTLKNLRAR